MSLAKANYKDVEVFWSLLVAIIGLTCLGFVACAQNSSQALTKGERQLSIEVTTDSGDDYGEAFVLAQSLGMEVTSLSLQWDELEPRPGNNGTAPNWLEIANDFFPTQAMSTSFMIGPIDTNNLRLPADLKDKAFDDPEVIERFERLLDYVFEQIPELELSSLAIGNEIDGYLGTNKRRWQEYSTFFREVSAYAKTKRSG